MTGPDSRAPVRHSGPNTAPHHHEQPQFGPGGRPLDPMAAHLWARRQVKPFGDAHDVPDTLEPIRYAATRAPDSPGVSGLPPRVIGRKPLRVTPPRKPNQVFQDSRALAQNLTSGPAHPSAIAPAAGAATVTARAHDLRVGDHPDKTRLVIDITAPVDFTYALDEAGKILTVTLPHTAWAGGPRRMTFPAHQILGTVHADSSAPDAMRFNVILKQPARVITARVFPPLPSGRPLHRIVFDLAPRL